LTHYQSSSSSKLGTGTRTGTRVARKSGATPYHSQLYRARARWLIEDGDEEEDEDEIGHTKREDRGRK
jgi:hypothetical protein